MPAVGYEVEGDIAVLTIDYPPVNALSFAVREGLEASLNQARDDTAVRAVIILGGGKTFIAGADITEFGTEKGKSGPSIAKLEGILEHFPKPTIAAIHGTALGGGLELALAAHARVAVAAAKVGLPEVNLGILPGAGGTQRLPRLTGIEAAVDIMTTGRHVPAAEALALGILDEIVAELRPGAVAFARQVIAKGTTFQPVIERNEKLRGVDPGVFSGLRKSVAKKARGKIAPITIIDCVEAACSMDATAGLQFETEKFHALYANDQRAALMYYFFAEREARKVPGLSAEPKKIKSAGVIGAGTMGGGIAMVLANAGIATIIVDINDEALAKGMATVRKNYEISVSRGSTPQAKMDAALGLITTAIDYADIAQCDIVIEAVFEKMELKKSIFAKLDAVMKPGAILATNTSSLNVDMIAAATARPQDVIGVHFFSPANVMKLQENIRGEKSSDQTIATVMALGKELGKNVVLARNCDGFIGNRMLQYYTGEAEFLLEQGASPEQVDRVAEAFGMPMGPFTMRDMSGMDVSVLVREERRKTLPPGERLSPVLERLVQRGRKGQKTGKGYYRYEGREKSIDPETTEVIEEVAREYGIERRSFTDAEIEARLFAPLVVEGAKELEDGTAIRASDIDVAWVNGYGFPAHKGGPMYWGERYGLDKICKLAFEAEARNGPRWAPGPLLQRLAAQGKGWKDA
jgi:3-hydroxyacyl-CoA dehydrogenase